MPTDYAIYEPSSLTVEIEVQAQTVPTRIEFIAPPGPIYAGIEYVFAARLLNAVTGAPIPGKTLIWTINDIPLTGLPPTDSQGMVSARLVFMEPGQYVVVVRFTG